MSTFTPFPHQVSGARFIGQRKRSLLLDDPGMGKTGTSILALDMRHKRFGNGIRGIVECPAIARDNWRDEFKIWTRVPRRYVIAEDLHDLISWERKRFDVLIASWEFLTKWSYRFDDMMEYIDFYIGDEFHRAKAEESKRKIACMGEDGRGGVSAWAHWGVALSGSIAPDDPIDLYNPLRWAGVIRSERAEFAKRYFKTIQGLRTSKNKPKKEAVPELRAMIDKVAIRRTLDDAGIHIPIFFSNRVIDGDRKDILQYLAEHPGLSEEVYRAIEGGDLALLNSPFVATLRRLIGEAKAIPYSDLIAEEIHDGKDKVVIFGIHRKALEMIHDRLVSHGISTALVQGGMSRMQTNALVDGFQKEGKYQAIILNNQTGGEAITLTASRYIDVFEKPWSPGPFDQIVRRVRRIGQTRNVLARTITLRNSHDEHVNSTVDRKNDNLGALGLRCLGETGEEEAA